jgi:hypothetical protein
MSIETLKENKSSVTWHNLETVGQTYLFAASFLPSSGFLDVKAYPQSGLSTLLVNVAILDENLNPLFSGSTFDLDTGSTVNFSQRTYNLSPTAKFISLTAPTAAAYVSIEYRKFSANPLNPIKYTASQTVVVGYASNFVLLGGGGGGGGANSGNQRACGGGSGYLATGTVSPGTYSLTIGSGGAGGTSGGVGGTGGVSTFNAVTANGGIGGTMYGTGANKGGNGGSGGGGSSGGNGGSNGGSGSGGGDNNPGSGSGVSATLFTPGSGGAGGSPGQGGGLYGGGGGGTLGVNASGGAASAGTGGGGGGANCPGSGASNMSGGIGGSGAMWIVAI